MDEISSCVEALLQNDTEVMEAAVDILIKIADNILREPDTPKYRSVNLSSKALERTLFPAIGALEVLFLMGFQEGDDQLVLPKDDPLDQLRSYRDQLVKLQGNKELQQASGAAKQPQVQRSQEGNADLRGRLVGLLGHVVVYESTGLQEKARGVMPVQRLHQRARDMMAVVNKDLKDGDIPLDFQDCVLRVVLMWFKDEFFKWFDAPTCDKCQQKMLSSGNLTPTQDDLLWGGSRVEGYTCKNCGATERFVRYNHPGKLLETRKGRCGEWANCFTFLCRTLGMDARYVLDFTDHVWTEVYSQSQNRWLHVDCEGKIDTPLMYEAGWGKKLNYIFAFSKDEVVDVTWRYTNKQAEVLRRRNLCTEDWLVTTVMELNKERQSNFTPEKRQFLEHRLVTEVSGFFSTPRTLKTGENEGRQSGSLAWRLARGETTVSQPIITTHTFKVSPEEQKKREFILKYCPSSDEYTRVSSKNQVMKGWQTWVVKAEGITRKHEADWKMVYLSRTEGSSEGEVQWCVDWSDSSLRIKSALVVLQHATFEDGCIAWQVCLGKKCMIGPKDGVLEVGEGDVSDKMDRLEVSVTMTKGKGDVAWQHTQLFRQADHLNDKFPFLIHIKFHKH